MACGNDLRQPVPGKVECDAFWDHPETPQPVAIPARLLSGEHVGREIVLPDGTTGLLVEVRHLKHFGLMTSIRLHPESKRSRPVAPDDVVTLVAETEARS